MPLIPRELRDGAVERSGSSRRLSSIYTGAEATVGLAAAAALPSLVEAGGVRAAAPSNASCAVAFTRLSKRGERIWGVPCSGVGPAEVGSPALGEAVFNFHANPASSAGSIVNPFGVPALLNVWGQLGDETRYPFTGFVTRTTGGGFYYREGGGPVPAGFAIPPGVPRSPSDPGTITGYFTRPATPAVPPVPNWKTAPPRLEWTNTGLPWWGVIEATSLAGIWVRRIAWPDAARKIRHVGEIGSTRAVAVDQDGVVLTPAGFGVAEFVGEDWRVVGDTSEPAPIDITDVVFSGPGVIFTVSASGSSTPGSGDEGGDSVVPVVPKSGEGFLYVRDGEVVLVEAKDCDGRPWRP